MNQHAIAFLGLSGVGKSTLLRELSSHVEFQHLQASALIKEGRQAAEAQEISTDTLRHVNIDENQQLLIAGYERSINPKAKLVILDGHSVIDTPAGLVQIDPSVFSALGISRVIFLADKPAEIVQRRQSDTSRDRPIRSVGDIDVHQDVALLNALRICLELQVPLNVVTPAQREHLRCLLMNIGRDAEC